MFLRAASFEAHTTQPEGVIRALRRQAEQLGVFDAQRELRPGGAVIFTFGQLSSEQRQLAQLIAEQCPGLPVLIAGGVGAMTERGEVSGASGASCLVWRGGQVQLEGIEVASALFPEEVQSILSCSERPNMGLLFVRPDGYDPSTIQKLGKLSLGRTLLGGGSLGDPGVIGVGAEGQFVEGRAVLLRASGAGLPSVQTAHSCRLLGPLLPITELRDSMVLRIGPEKALDALSKAGKSLDGQPLVQVVLAPATPSPEPAREEWLIRGIQGIDPEARGLVISEQPSLGQLMGFAVQDASAARSSLKTSCRLLSQQLAGALPLCGLLVRSAQRGQPLYGRENVDTRLLAEQFEGLPFAGLKTPFEISPAGDSGTFQVFSSVFALFSALS